MSGSDSGKSPPRLEGKQDSLLTESPSGNEVFPTSHDVNLPQVIALQSLLSQFSNVKVRADFVNGRLGPNTNPNLLVKIDQLRCTLCPQWPNGGRKEFSSTSLAAANHVTKLLNDSEDIFSIEPDNEDDQFTYHEWHQTLDYIASSKYWTRVPSDQRCAHLMNPTEKTSPPSNRAGSVDSLTEALCNLKKEGTINNEKKSDKEETKIKKKKSQKVEEIVISSSGSSSQSQSSSQADGTSDDDKGATSKPRHRRRVDRREIITPPIFRVSAGISLKDSLETFEEYFNNKYKGNTYDKSQKLQDFLEDELLTVYLARGGRSVKFEHMKKYLLAHYKKQKIGTKSYWRKKLEELEPKDDESLDIYGMRLLEVARLAFPSSNKECATKVRERFLRAIPSTITAKILDTERTLKASSKGKTKHLIFDSLMTMARDIQKESNIKQTPSTPIPVMWSGGNRAEDTKAAFNFPSRTFQSSSPRKKFNSPQQRPQDNAGCSHCGSSTHNIDQCWRAAGLCLICGGKHAMENCPKYNPNFCYNRKAGEFSGNVKVPRTPGSP